MNLDDKANAEKYRQLQAHALLSRFYKAHPEAKGRPQDEQIKMVAGWAAKNIAGQIEPTEEEAETFFRKLVESVNNEGPDLEWPDIIGE